MSKEDNILNKLKKTERPSVPSDYFDNFASSLDLKEDETSFLEALPKTKRPKIPAEFLENFSGDLLTKLDKPKKKKVISLKSMFISVVSAAAVISIVFFATQNRKYPPVAELHFDAESYLAFIDFDESEYVDFMIDNNISYDDDIDDDVLYELDNELDEYFYEL